MIKKLKDTYKTFDEIVDARIRFILHSDAFTTSDGTLWVKLTPESRFANKFNDYLKSDEIVFIFSTTPNDDDSFDVATTSMMIEWKIHETLSNKSLTIM